MKILTTSEMREADRLTSERCGISSRTLMENAGSSVAQFLASNLAPIQRRRIVVLCGKGNNGGDGFVAARKLAELGASPLVFLLAGLDELRGDAAENFQRLQSASLKPATIHDASAWTEVRNSLASADVVVDALLGTGLRGKVEGLFAQAIEDVNRPIASRAVVAIDIPSGLSGDSGEVSGPAVAADYTVTFTSPKIGMILAPASSYVGRLIVADIGTPRELIEEISKSSVRWLEPWEFRTVPLRRKVNTNKGDFGHALIVAGSVGKAGAAALAAQGALRAGAGLVTVATPGPALANVAGFAPEIMTEPLHSTPAGTIARDVFDSGGFAAILRGKNILAIGPGLSTHEDTQQFVRSVIASKLDLPVILDADGLNAFSGHASELRGSREMLALTPHPGEMARLLGITAREIQDRRLEVACKSAADWKTFVILKGHQTVIASPDGRAWINSTGNSGMASAGMGDVLTGMLAGITGQFGAKSWPLSLALGVYLHGLAGDIASTEADSGPIIASDLIRAIPHAFAQLVSSIEHV
ncbi:MAG TPA: NAD(P)H-hydrate dehydratase [Candidatus Acidoferrales bacterium]|nr:NAD(P)H-hydrate dehydratase [Candidatus Acidoferrales bacterium]